MQDNTAIAIDDVLNDFDFDSVQVAMTKLDWKWYIDGVRRTPTTDELKTTASLLLRDAVNRHKLTKRGAFSQHGGLCAEIKYGRLHLFFRIGISMSPIW